MISQASGRTSNSASSHQPILHQTVAWAAVMDIPPVRLTCGFPACMHLADDGTFPEDRAGALRVPTQDPPEWGRRLR